MPAATSSPSRPPGTGTRRAPRHAPARRARRRSRAPPPRPRLPGSSSTRAVISSACCEPLTTMIWSASQRTPRARAQVGRRSPRGTAGGPSGRRSAGGSCAGCATCRATRRDQTRNGNWSSAGWLSAERRREPPSQGSGSRRRAVGRARHVAGRAGPRVARRWLPAGRAPGSRRAATRATNVPAPTRALEVALGQELLERGEHRDARDPELARQVARGRDALARRAAAARRSRRGTRRRSGDRAESSPCDPPSPAEGSPPAPVSRRPRSACVASGHSSGVPGRVRTACRIRPRVGGGRR